MRSDGSLINKNALDRDEIEALYGPGGLDAPVRLKN